eukprot:1786188-Amphidinium_carterae.1
MRFTLYSLRRGGATEDFRLSQNLPRVLLKGRWSDTTTARIYLNEGLALQAQTHFGADLQADLTRRRDLLLQLF